MTKKILKKEFFEQPTLVVAEGLLGKFLVRRYKGREISAMITEVEAYDGLHDRASHAHRGETARTSVMFGNAGVWYVYLIYGMHNMLNIVTGGVDYPAAILIRGVQDARGPGKVTKFFHIDGKLNKKKALPAWGLWIEEKGICVPKKNIARTSRIGVLYAGPTWANKPYRFILKDHNG
jgi:DNA-3-methyladenine glycosylase